MSEESQPLTPDEKRELRQNLSVLLSLPEYHKKNPRFDEMLVGTVEMAIRSDNIRDRNRTIEVMERLRGQDINLMIQLDRILRLEAGLRTENHGGKIEVVYVDKPHAD